MSLDPDPHGWVANALRIVKRTHAPQREGRDGIVVRHGPDGGHQLHSHVIHEDWSVEAKNVYADHINRYH